MPTTLDTLRAPKSDPIWGQSTEFNRNQLRYLTELARDYDDIVPLRLFLYRAAFFNRPDLVEEILVTKHRAFVKSVAFRRFAEVTGFGVITSDGEHWRKQHRLVQPGFHRQRVESFAQAMVERADSMRDEWQHGEEREIQADMMRVTLEVVCRTMFSADVSSDARALGESFTEALDAVYQRVSGVQVMVPGSVPLPTQVRVWRATRRLDQMVYRMIREHKESGDRGDLLSMLLEARDETGAAMSDRQVRDEVMNIVVAGHETTACALTWVWYLLAQHPEVEARLHAEIDEVLGGRLPTVEDLPRLAYTGHIVTEVLRLYPPVWITTREAIQDVTIGGHELRKGTIAIFCQWTIQRDARYFERPDAFEPERWADGLARRLPRFAYFPFGGGPRVCLGNTFSLMEATLVIATIASRFRLALVPGQTITPHGGVTLRAKPGIQMRLIRR
jgi:cytochrome P450